jgi:hypothetical protein
MPRSTSNVIWTIVLALLALLGLAAALLGPRLYREGRAFLAPIAELAASEKAMAALDEEFPFEPPESGIVPEERLTLFLEIGDELRVEYTRWQGLVNELEGRRAQSWQEAKEAVAATRDVHRTQREALRVHGMSPAELVWLEDVVASWWRQIEPRLGDADRPAVTERLRRAREGDLHLVAELVRRYGPSPALEEMERHLEESLASLDSSTVPEVEGVPPENQRLFWRHRAQIAPIQDALHNPLHQMIREQGRLRLTVDGEGRPTPGHGHERHPRD